jgi:hypothetical protein
MPGAPGPVFRTGLYAKITTGDYYTMEKAARKGGFFKFQCPGDLQAAVTPEPTCQILAKLLQKVKATNLPKGKAVNHRSNTPKRIFGGYSYASHQTA